MWQTPDYSPIELPGRPKSPKRQIGSTLAHKWGADESEPVDDTTKKAPDDTAKKKEPAMTHGSAPDTAVASYTKGALRSLRTHVPATKIHVTEYEDTTAKEEWMTDFSILLLILSLSQQSSHRKLRM